MKALSHFTSLGKQYIPECKTLAEVFRHNKCGADVVVLSNDDINKAFGIAFRTPPCDSTGVQHILEHTVFCGSRNYPVKDVFAEILKGSLQNFLNAYTYLDSTCFLLASPSMTDFYNLMNIYLDSVFYPRLAKESFLVEGWHYEYDKAGDSLIYKGVVYSEMKGYYTSEDVRLKEYIQKSLFPDNVYFFNPGGAPEEIPKLSWKQLIKYHKKYYHPSNGLFYFYGNGNIDKNLIVLNDYLDDFEKTIIKTGIPPQSPFKERRSFTFPYPVSISGKRASDHIITLNWALKDRPDIEDTLVYMILDFILVRMSSSPLRNKLINANIGKHLAGQGLYADLQQPCFSIGLKGVSSKNVNMVETYIMQTLNALVKEGIDPRIIQAALNRTEFSLYEGNFGKIPPGIQYMLRAMSGWLYNSDPLNRITFEATLKALKTKIKNNSCFFEDLIENYFLKNKHRATIILYPDATLLKREENEERKRLHAVRTCMSDTELNNIITMSEKLSLLHKSPDSKEARSTLPEIKLSKEILDDDFPVVIPYKLKEMQLLYNNLPGRGIVYITLGFDIHTLPLEYLPFARLYTRALLQMGTKKYRYVELNQLINQNTGGIHTGFLNIIKRGSEESVTRIFLKSRTLINRVEALTGILKEVLVFSQLDNLERFKQLVREEIARHESMLVTEEVHKILRYRLQAHFNEAGWVCEHISGINYISFLRRLLADIENNWDYVLNVLRNMHSILCNRNTMIINIMADKSSQSKINKCLERIIESIPARQKSSISWKYDSLIESEGFAIPTTLGMVAKGVNITHLDETIYGTGLVVNQYLKTSWFWNKIRIQGGAYGLYSSFDRLSGIFSVISYRDPDIVRTLGLFNKSACVLDDIKLNKDELKRYIIGALREFHPYRAPDATGHLAVAYFLAGVNITELQNIRNKILDTTFKDIYRLSDLLRSFADSKIVKIIASDTIINTVKESCLQDLVLYNII